MSAIPTGEAPIRASLLRSLRERVNELPGLIDALDLETLPGAFQAEIDRLTAENQRLKGQVEAWMRSADNDGATIKQIGRERGQAQDEAARLAAENERLTGELTKYVGWEPTAKEEYEHACGQLEKVTDLVRAFRDDHIGRLHRPGSEEAVIAFVADLKNALEMP